MQKIFIDVTSIMGENGIQIPVVIRWNDGRRFDVSSMIFIASSPTGDYEGIRYTIIIEHAEKYIYRANRRWYVMAGTGGEGGEEFHNF